MPTVPAPLNHNSTDGNAQQLAQAQQELKSLTYAISHDLRAPLRAITGFSQALKEHSDTTLDTTARHYLKRIEESAQHLSVMIDGLLQLSRLSQSPLAPASVDLNALCNSINQELAAQFPQHSPQIHVTSNAATTIIGDTQLLRIAVHALLHNAWKFTQDSVDARIDVNISNADNHVVLSIRDNGIGFDARYTDKLCVPFQHLQARTPHHGAGIGLASALRVVNRHGGALGAESLQRGSVFSLTLPTEPQQDITH